MLQRRSMLLIAKQQCTQKSNINAINAPFSMTIYNFGTQYSNNEKFENSADTAFLLLLN